ncbi:MAG: UbiX family flavin prenyltransferase [Gammaproteobacteria bacterium]|nr:UbiX family flavin prenyltransferase [Gammaproteobacteria bacterium]
MSNLNLKTVTLAITGASGAQYGLRLMECLLAADYRVDVMISKAAQVVIATETDIKLPAQRADRAAFFAERYKAKEEQLRFYGLDQWLAPVASGSSIASTMVVCPCSTGSLAAISQGHSNNLIERAADVTLKEGKKLILVPRETPYSTIHLENMLKLSQMGVTILPASPGFYNKPTDIQHMIDFIVGRILDHLGVEQTIAPRWGD